MRSWSLERSYADPHGLRPCNHQTWVAEAGYLTQQNVHRLGAQSLATPYPCSPYLYQHALAQYFLGQAVLPSHSWRGLWMACKTDSCTYLWCCPQGMTSSYQSCSVLLSHQLILWTTQKLSWWRPALLEAVHQTPAYAGLLLSGQYPARCTTHCLCLAPVKNLAS